MFLKKLGFKRSSSDSGLFIHVELKVLVYVDDLSLWVACEKTAEIVKSKIQLEFKVKDLGVAHFYLGIRIRYHSNGISLSQCAFAEKILKTFQMQDSKIRSTPLDPSMRFNNCDRQSDSNICRSNFPFVSCLRMLRHYSSGTRPDLSFAVSLLSRFASKYSDVHVEARKHVLRYVQKTKDFGLFYKHDGNKELSSWSDADWATDASRRSTSGNIHLLASASVHWMSRLQSIVATSTCDAE